MIFESILAQVRIEFSTTCGTTAHTIMWPGIHEKYDTHELNLGSFHQPQPQPASSQHQKSLQSQLTMLLTSPKKLKHRENELLARTGVSKAGYLLKRQSSSSLTSQWRWESTFLILNSHTLSYCSQKDNFNKPVGNLLLTASTRVYHQAEEAVIRVETGVEVMLLKGRDMTDIKEWKKAIHSKVEKLTELARGRFGVKCKSGKVTDHFLMLHRWVIWSKSW